MYQKTFSLQRNFFPTPLDHRSSRVNSSSDYCVGFSGVRKMLPCTEMNERLAKPPRR